MGTRIRTHLRSNVVGYIALFVALSGTAWAVGKIGARDIAANAVRSKHIKNGQVKAPDVAADSLTGAQVNEASLLNVDAETLDGFDSAVLVKQGDVDTVDPDMIQNIIRSVSIPLASFVDCQSDTGAFLDFSGAADAIADFNPVHPTTDGRGFTIRFDDTAGTPDQNSEICSQAMLPDDYAGLGIVVAVRASKDGHSGADERLEAAASINGAPPVASDLESLASASNTLYSLQLPGPPDGASSIGLSLSINPLGGDMNDAVDIHAVAVAYAATQ